MTSREDCLKWICDHTLWTIMDYRPSVQQVADAMHEFSKTTIGHFPEEEEKQKGSL